MDGYNQDSQQNKSGLYLFGQDCKQMLRSIKEVCLSGSVPSIKSKMQTVGISGIVALSMTVYFFTGFLNSYVLFALLLCMFTGCYVASKALVLGGNGEVELDYIRLLQPRRKIWAEKIWYLPLVSLLVGFAQGSWKMGNLIDLITIVCCLAVIYNVPNHADCYSVTKKLMGGFALFYAAGIWVQMLFPDAYTIYLSALNNGADTRITGLDSYYTGFTTSPGHTASYIALGMCVFAQDFFEKKWRTIMIEVFLVLSMMFAGMRMPVLAAGICGALFVMMIIPPKKRKAFFGVVFCTALVLGVFVLVFQKPLSKIPVFARTFASIQSLFSGGDASSGRTGLYKHAISLFMQHPFFGIGWGNYRNTVVGVVTQETPFDVHNIYLQLLCETGIVGCVCFAVPMVMTLVMSIRNYELLLRKKPSAKWTKLMGISCMFQLYFLLFGMTDNVLFYVFESSCYLICCSISVAYARGLAVRKARRCEKEGNL